MMLRALAVCSAASVLCLLLASTPAAAQGNGRGNAFGHSKAAAAGAAAAPSATITTTSAPGAPIEGTGIRNFGSWLDDASILAPGTGFTSFAVGYWRTASFREIDVPSFDVGIGLHRRIQVGASVPFYHASQPGSAVVRGMGDVYLSSKIQLRDPAAGKTLGIAVIPIVEVLSVAPATGASRVSWALPVAVEVQRSGWRVYGSTGYFSRGALFASGAVEVAVNDRTWVTAAISESRSNAKDDLSEALGYSKVRADVSGGAGFAVAPSIAVFGTVGRTISRHDANSSKIFLSGGLSVYFPVWR
jgi:hypothetical protein